LCDTYTANAMYPGFVVWALASTMVRLAAYRQGLWRGQGRYSPSLEMAFEISRVFDVRLDEIFQYPGGG